MTISTNLQTYGFDSTDTGNTVAESIRLLDVYYVGTLAEGSDSNWDAIIEALAHHLMDRKRLVRKSVMDASVIVPPQMPRLIIDMIRELKSQAFITDNPAKKIVFDSVPPKYNSGQHWRDTLS